MLKYMPKWLKTTLIISITLIVAVGIGIDIWYMSIVLTGKERIPSKTFNVGTLTLADGTQQDIIEIEYFTNKDNSGYEAFEIKYNYFLDETKEQLFSQGFQYIADAETSINIDYTHNCLAKKEDKEKANWNLFTGNNTHYDCQNSYVPASNVSTYNYMSSGEQYLKSTNPINLNSRFKIQIGKDLYLMQFKGLDTPKNSTTYITTYKDNNAYNDYFHHQYYIYDAHYFSKLLYESIKSANLGTNQNLVFEFGNLFNYYASTDDNGTYEEEVTDYDNVVKVSGDIKSYYSIRVKIHENGLSSSNESMFGSILGNQNFALNGDYTSGDYFIGRTIVDCDVSAFDFVIVEDNNIALKLSDAFINYYKQYKSTIALSVMIDLDLISKLGYNFVGFTADSGLDMFNILECYTTSNNEIVQDYTNSLEVLYV